MLRLSIVTKQRFTRRWQKLQELWQEITPLSFFINVWEHPAQGLWVQYNFISGVKIRALKAWCISVNSPWAIDLSLDMVQMVNTWLTHASLLLNRLRNSHALLVKGLILSSINRGKQNQVVLLPKLDLGSNLTQL